MLKFIQPLAIFLFFLGNFALANETPKPAEEVPAPVAGPQRDYNPGKVLPFPKFSGDSISGGASIAFTPSRGQSVIVIFIASWCEPCQVLMPELKQLAKKYTTSSNKVFFVFAHDTKTDAAAFAKEHQLTSPALIANVDILTDFKNPELPSVYVGDKWGYFADRYIKIAKEDIDRLDTKVAKLTAL